MPTHEAIMKFQKYKYFCANTMTKATITENKALLEDQAIPAYLEGNFFSRWFFWKRIETCFKYIEQLDFEQTCIDFGCGSGLMIPVLSTKLSKIYAIDLKLKPAINFVDIWKKENAGNNCEILFSQNIPCSIQNETVDLILALDVLEHIDSLDEIIDIFHTLLSKKGRLIISGPTENAWYKIGRKIVGFSGHYHVRNIFDIINKLDQVFKINILDSAVKLSCKYG